MAVQTLNYTVSNTKNGFHQYTQSTKNVTTAIGGQLYLYGAQDSDSNWSYGGSYSSFDFEKVTIKKIELSLWICGSVSSDYKSSITAILSSYVSNASRENYDLTPVGDNTLGVINTPTNYKFVLEGDDLQNYLDTILYPEPKKNILYIKFAKCSTTSYITLYDNTEYPLTFTITYEAEVPDGGCFVYNSKNQWEYCMPNVFNGTEWIECEIMHWDGSKWTY